LTVRVDEASGIMAGGPGALDALRQAVAPPTYGYEPGTRRDPFLDLARRRPPSRGGVGLGRFLVEELARRGIVETRGSRVALLAAPDGRTYFVTPGARLFDGVVTAVDAASITFRQELVDPLSTSRTRLVRFVLHAEDTSRTFEAPR
jgi:hypothetical protein